MDKDEVEDNGVPIETLSEKAILEEIKDRLRQVGNLVGESILQLYRDGLLMLISQLTESHWTLK